MRPIRRATLATSLRAASLLAAGAAQAAATCQSQPFPAWLQGVKAEAVAQGVSPAVADAALAGVAFDRGIVSRDRGQGVFSQTFLDFAGRMAAGYRISKGASLIRANAATFARIDKLYGVPAPIIAAFWGLETDFGANMGDLPTLASVATLAYDCRRPQMFRPQLIAALQVIQRGDLTAAQMRGPWAGELGQFQFQPSYYVKYAVDFDGDGRRDLIRSTPDALGSAGSFLAGLGWQRGQPWLQEVRVPRDMPWEQAGLDIEHPRSQWAAWGVAGAGAALPADGTPASLLLPMGRNGPAFLAYRNFRVYLKWNQSLVYATTAAYLATRIAGAPAVSRGNAPVTALSASEVKALQQLLVKGGYEVGEVDGKLGAVTRDGVRRAQLKFGLPADAWPTRELTERLRAGR